MHLELPTWSSPVTVVQAGFYEKVLFQRVVAPEWVPQCSGHSPNLPKFKEHLANSLRLKFLFLCGPVWIQGFRWAPSNFAYSMILQFSGSVNGEPGSKLPKSAFRNPAVDKT